MTRLARSARRSMTLPLPSSPHCPPTRMMTIGSGLLAGLGGGRLVGPAAPRLQVLEARQLGAEPEVDGAGRAVPVLGHDDLGEAGRVGLVVVALPIKKDYNVGILFDATALSQIGEHRALVGSLLGSPGQLRVRHRRHVQLPGQI